MEAINNFKKHKYGALYLDIFLLFSLSIALSIFLYFLNNVLGELFLVFALLCCIFISYSYYSDVNADIDKVVKDLEILIKGGIK